jgi:hypothetical protein
VTGWIIGFAVGAVVVVVVVALLLGMIVLARRLNAKAEDIVEALHAARDNTRGLWEVAATNATADRIVAAAGRAREGLAGEEGQP